MKIVRRIFWLVVLAAVFAGAIYAFQPQPIAVDMLAIDEGPLEVTIDEDGKTRIKEKYIVSSPVSGRLQRIEWEPGDRVTSGKTILASVEPSNPELLDARTLAQAKAQVSAKEAASHRAKTRLDQVNHALGLAEKEFGRAKELQKTKAITKSEFERAEMEFRSQTEASRSAQFDKEIAEFELQLAKAALLHVQPGSSKESLQIFEIKSPINGSILRVFQESTTILAPGTPLVEIGDPADLEIIVDVLSTDAVKIKKNPSTEVRLEQWGGDESFNGRVRLVEPAAFEKISALGVEEQRVNVIIDFDETQAAVQTLGDGYRVEAKIVIWKKDNIIRVPTSALFREKNERAVYVVEENKIKLAKVQVGKENDQFAEVLSGLSPGQTVIAYPGDKLADGIVVTPREK